MHILVIDGGHVEAEFREKFGSAHKYKFWQNTPHIFTEDEVRMMEAGEYKVSTPELGTPPDAIFIFKMEGYWNWDESREPNKCVVFRECSTNSLPEALGGMPTFGFCGLPTLINRPLLEVSLYHEADREKLAETCAALGTDYRVVKDRVGLVTPRVICMIINEACYTVQEGTATMQDVDLGMKLGTNYPRGPFAWANAIGVTRVYAVLEAMWDDTHDERYKVCPLLKRQALRGEPFAV